jgi:hypothetical protein
MFRALVTCPDNECAEAFDAVAELEQLESLICDCGCTLRVERVSEHEDEDEFARGEFELTLLA